LVTFLHVVRSIHAAGAKLENLAVLLLESCDSEGFSMMQSVARKVRSEPVPVGQLAVLGNTALLPKGLTGPEDNTAVSGLGADKVLPLGADTGTPTTNQINQTTGNLSKSAKKAIKSNLSHTKEAPPLNASNPTEAEAAAKINDAADAVAKAHAKGKKAEQASEEAAKAAETVPPDRRWDVWRNVFVGRQQERKRLFVRCSILPIGSVLVFAVLASLFLCGHVQRTSVQQAARSVYLTVNFVLVLNYTIVILDSYDLCSTLGLSKADSGRMVGTYMLGFCAGAVGSWLAVRVRPLLWRELPKTLLFAGLSCQLAGSVAYSIVALKATVAAGKIADLPLVGIAKALFGLRDSPWLAHLLMASRFTGGAGSGICQQFYVSSMLHVTPVHERSEHTSRWVFSGMLAIGLGPMMAAAVQALDLCGHWPRFELVGHVQLLATGVALFAVLLHPDVSRVEDCLEPEHREGAEEASQMGGNEEKDGSLISRRWLVTGCLLMTGLRAFGISAIEVGIALRLEETYLWDQRVTGLVIGAIFLCCVPLKVIHALVGPWMTAVGWIRVLSCLAVVGSLLLFNSTCQLLTLGGCLQNCATVLVTAGVVLFPCFYLSDALGSGLMHQHVLPEGSLLDANHAQLWYNLCQGMGRFLGPWMARLALQLHGEDAFAVQQTAAIGAFLLGFETFVRPAVKPTGPTGASQSR